MVVISLGRNNSLTITLMLMNSVSKQTLRQENLCDIIESYLICAYNFEILATMNSTTELYVKGNQNLIDYSENIWTVA